jgi:excisionase family DNA binding protein
MNLVDAIRAAAQKPQEPVETPLIPVSYRVEHEVHEVQDTPSDAAPPVKATQAQVSSNMPITSEDSMDGMRVVRFEVLLTQQQVGDLLQWLAHNMRSVMTLREAAHYLRLRAAQVQALAEHGDLPAFRVDGKWRFFKTTLDEWMSLQQASDFETVPQAQEGKQVA